MASLRSRRSALDIRIACLSCTHSPFTDMRSFGEALRRIRGWKPHVVVHLGDLLESAAASVHPHEHTHDQRDEYKHAADLLRRLEVAAGGTCHTRVWMLGNHDQNIVDPDPRRIPRNLRSAVHWANQSPDLSDTFARWKQVPYVNSVRGAYTVGPVTFVHGFRTGVNSDFTEALEFHYLTGGHPGQLVVRGHTHRPVPPTRVVFHGVPFHVSVMNVGHLSPAKPDYMSRRSSALWGHAVGLIRVRGGSWDANLELLP